MTTMNGPSLNRKNWSSLRFEKQNFVKNEDRHMKLISMPLLKGSDFYTFAGHMYNTHFIHCTSLLSMNKNGLSILTWDHFLWEKIAKDEMYWNCYVLSWYPNVDKRKNTHKLWQNKSFSIELMSSVWTVPSGWFRL